MDKEYVLRVQDLSVGYAGKLVMQKLNFVVKKNEIFIIMGPSGSGKTTVLKNIIGLQRPFSGKVFFGDVDFWDLDTTQQVALMRRFGVLYQGGALWSSLTLAENVALPLQLHTGLSSSKIEEIVQWKLALVGLFEYKDFYPSQLSGGMRKRAGLARAMALEPDILFLDEPSSGLDPINARMLDDLIVQLSATLHITIVMVTHELASIFAVGTNSVLLDPQEKTIIAYGPPRELLRDSKSIRVKEFLTRAKYYTKE